MAERLDMNLRTFERLEAGRITLSVARLIDVSVACDADALGLFAALLLNQPELAAATADAKPLMALARALAGIDPSP